MKKNKTVLSRAEKNSDLSINEIVTPGWLYLENPSAQENKQAMDIEMKKENNGAVGKYLFFSDDKQALINLGKKILKQFNLYEAKVPLSDSPASNDGFGFVLCIYDSKPRLKHVLKDFADFKKIHYRYWKSDNATINNEYSLQFQKREIFQKYN